VAVAAPALPAQSSPLVGASPASAYLDVLRTRSDMQQAAAELARADALLQRAMLSPSEREDRRASYVRARLAHVGALLAAADARAHVGIERAVKTRTTDGRLRVALTLRNDGAPLDALPSRGADAVDADADGIDPAALARVRDARVWLKTEAGPNGATISRPYERTLRELPVGAARVVWFELLEDVTDVVVVVDAAGRTEERRIRQEVASDPSVITLDAAQFSLEGDLGAQVVYDLRLRRPRPSASAARLAVRGLPPDVAYEFRDPDGRTRLGQLRFPDGATTARVQLAVTLPARPSTVVRPDAPLPFDVVATDEDSGTARRAPVEGHARLEVVPRGIARLELRPAALAVQAVADAPTVLSLVVRNAGTGRIDDVRVRAELPTRWEATTEPAAIASLGPGDERRVAVRIRPPRDAMGGDYELRVGIDDASAARRIDVEDKIIRVRVSAGGGLALPILGALGAAIIAALLLTHGRRWLNR
jgi:hypothetical protein